ncbi:MAG: hypothetical protein QXV93_01055 [Zestosphaera sp.]
MKKLFVMGASGKLVRHIVSSLTKDYELFLQCSRKCEELREFLVRAGGGLSNSSTHLIRHDFLEEGVESLSKKLRELTSSLDASILIEPVFDQTPFQDLREDLIKKIIYLDLVVPVSLIRILTPFMSSRESVIIVLVDLTPFEGSRVYAGLNPSLPTVASSAALYAVVKESLHYLPSNIKVFGVALDWVRVPSKKLPSNVASVAMSVEDVVRFVKGLLEEPSKISSGALIRLSRRGGTT